MCFLSPLCCIYRRRRAVYHLCTMWHTFSGVQWMCIRASVFCSWVWKYLLASSQREWNLRKMSLNKFLLLKNMQLVYEQTRIYFFTKRENTGSGKKADLYGEVANRKKIIQSCLQFFCTRRDSGISSQPK